MKSFTEFTEYTSLNLRNIRPEHISIYGYTEETQVCFYGINGSSLAMAHREAAVYIYIYIYIYIRDPRPWGIPAQVPVCLRPLDVVLLPPVVVLLPSSSYFVCFMVCVGACQLLCVGLPPAVIVSFDAIV